MEFLRDFLIEFKKHKTLNTFVLIFYVFLNAIKKRSKRPHFRITELALKPTLHSKQPINDNDAFLRKAYASDDDTVLLALRIDNHSRKCRQTVLSNQGSK